jgi:hypothetical protein
MSKNINQSAPMSNGTRVRVKKHQGRLGGDKYPGRFGSVVRLNSVALPDRLYYVDLEPTKRAKARRETFWERDLIELTENQ